MQILYRRCCGMDVHKKSVVACALVVDNETGEERRHKRTFGTMTRDLLELGEWLRELQVEAAAMEATGVYWKPVWNILEQNLGALRLMLVNAKHYKQVPGRKTDQKDAEWLAELVQHGLVRGSFVPGLVTRQLRDLTRSRATLMEEHTAVANRLQKLLEESNIKLASVASNVLGVSARRMLKELARGNRDAAAIADLALHRLRGKLPQLRAALDGRMSVHQQEMLTDYLSQLEFLEERAQQCDGRIQELLETADWLRLVEQLDSIPGVDRIVAAVIIAELGADMGQYPSAAHAASWAGMCPGNHVSAGKRYSGTTNKGNVWLRRALCQAAWAASKTKSTYLATMYRRLMIRRGKKRAIIALGHQILVIAYEMLKSGKTYTDLGPANDQPRNPAAAIRHHVQKLAAMGFSVTLAAANQ